MLQKWFKETHWPLVFGTLGLCLFGTLFIYSASFHDSGTYLNKQFFWSLIALAVFFGVPFLGYRTFLSISYLIYAVGITLLILVFLVGSERLGAQRWIHIGPLIVQPSEFAKFATIIALAQFLGSNHSWHNHKTTILKALLLGLAPVALIVVQPDLGSSLIFIPVILVSLFLWGIRKRYILLTAVAGVVLTPLAWQFLKPYQKKRIAVFMNPDLDPLGAGYTAIQSKIAVGSGGLFGKGFLQGTQSQLQFVPEHHTDFIFCVIGEEWGFMGALMLLVLYGFLFRACFHIMDHTTDLKAKLLVAGVVAVLFSQVFINIGMSYGLMPITGITLPLVSYGGSSLVTTAFGLGLILSIYKERSIF